MTANESMGDLIDVTVVIPAWRTAAFISATIDSVLAQDFRGFRTIVVNDGCPETESLERVLAPYREKGQIEYVRQENQGVSAARNTGIRLAQTTFVATVDSDDIWEPNFLSSVRSVITSDPAIVMCWAHPVYFGSPKLEGKKGVDVFPTAPGPFATFRDLVTRRVYPSPTGVFRRETALAVGMYPVDLKTAEDYDFQLRMSRAGKVAYIYDPPLYRCRIRPNSLTKDREIGLCRIQALQKQLKIADLTAEERDFLNGEIELQKAWHGFGEGRYQFAYGDRARGIELMENANRLLRSRRSAVILHLCRLFPRLMRSAAKWRDTSTPEQDVK